VPASIQADSLVSLGPRIHLAAVPICIADPELRHRSLASLLPYAGDVGRVSAYGGEYLTAATGPPTGVSSGLSCAPCARRLGTRIRWRAMQPQRRLLGVTRHHSPVWTTRGPAGTASGRGNGTCCSDDVCLLVVEILVQVYNRLPSLLHGQDD
jgi:hypothetical protein